MNETGVLVKSRKGRKVSVERESGRMLVSGKQLDSVQEETPAVSRNAIVDRKHNRPLLLQKRRHRLTEKNPRNFLVPGDDSPSGRKDQKACKKSSKESARIRRVIIEHASRFSKLQI